MTVGVAVLGCAHVSHAWSYARSLSLSSAARLVGVFDVDPQLCEPFVRDFDAPVYPDAAALVEEADVDAVVVCSATADHRSYVEMAAERGRHVLCEKPLATTVHDAAAMIAACQRGGVQLHCAFVSRFLPLVQHARAVLQAGDLGDVIGMVAGNRGRPPLPPQYPDWITSPSQAGGGALIDHSVHVTDVLRHLTGREVRRVSAEVDSLLWGLSVDDVALMTMTFDGGAVASIDPSWSVPAGNPWDYDFYCRILGSVGSLSITDTAESLQLVSRHVGSGLRNVSFGADADTAMIEAFTASIRSGTVLDPCADGTDGLRALEVALAGYESAHQRQMVDLPRPQP